MSYPTASKVVIDGQVVQDLTSDTVTPDTLLKGVTAHNASGEKITGTYESNIGHKYFEFSNLQIPAGAIGERGYQATAALDYSGYAIGVVITYISDSSYCIPVAFLGGNNLYLNLYRTSTNERTVSVNVRVTYIAD